MDCFNTTLASVVVAGTQTLLHGHYHGDFPDDVAVLDNGSVLQHGAFARGEAAEALRKEHCGTVALPRTYATPAETCLVMGPSCPGYRCTHDREVA